MAIPPDLTFAEYLKLTKPTSPTREQFVRIILRDAPDAPFTTREEFRRRVEKHNLPMNLFSRTARYE